MPKHSGRILAWCAVTGVAVWLGVRQLSQEAASSASRPTQWAQPVALEGVPNLHQVTPVLFRSAQPSAAGMSNLAARGIKTVINLRLAHSDADELRGLPLRGEAIPLETWDLKEAEAVQFLRLALDTNRAPVLVHCQHGADRTGAMCAIYRMAVQNWTPEEALREMTQGGYRYHPVWKGLTNWLQNLDVKKLRATAGVHPVTGDW